MLYRNNGEWALCEHKVRYIQHGEDIEQFVGKEGKQWWIYFAEQWGHTEIVEFISVVATDEQFTRLEEINTLNIPDGHSEILGDYVIRNKFPSEVSHLLKDLQLEKLNSQLGTEISEREINEIIMGVQISDIEIQLLELQLGGI